MRTVLGITLAVALGAGCYDGQGTSGDDDDDDEVTGGAANPTLLPESASTGMTTDPSAATSSPPPMTDGEGEMSDCASGPLAAPLPGCAPTPPTSTGDPHQDCVDRINQFRWECQCLPPLERWVDGEACTNDQSAADQNGGGAHGNFGDCGEWAQNTCPNWGSADDIINGCLQGMWDEGPGEPFSAHGHYINMSSLEYTKVACGFAGPTGMVWSNQNFQ